ncbi:hypothetical protein KY327_02750 [Candidatus Woesearchaeota archaeon]|nr:hypothetical protein [Candidatus Woesearchaeota archaeon]
MKRLITLILIALVSTALATAIAPDATNKTDTGKGLPGNATTKALPTDDKPAANGTGAAGNAPEQARQAVERIQERVEAQERVRNQSYEGMGEAAREARMNQNRVRTTVQALLEVGNMTGGIGQQVSEVAREFNNSVQQTIQAEEQVRKKSGLARFFTGGAEKAARQLENQTAQNQQRIQELQQLHDQCDCEEPVKEMLQQQIRSLEQEQQRLQELAQEERQKKGLLGWIWK